jgi:hypothetical protein
MKRNAVCLAFVILLATACTSKPEAAVSEDSATPAAPATSANPPSGTWSGDYGPNADRREHIRVDLRWEGAELRGMVYAGARSLDLTRASFQPDTGAITMEFNAQGNNGQMVHYTIEGKVEGNTMSGTWKHATQNGDFRITRQ